MSTHGGEPPGIGASGGGASGGGGEKKSYAALLSSNLPSVWNKNLLEVVLEKDVRGSFNVSEEDCARVMRKLGLDHRPGVVESVQICPNGRGVLLITLKKDVSIEMFCRHDVFQVTQSGIRAVHVKAAGKRDVVVTMKGIHPNTRDDGVMDYLAKYGKLISTKVVYAAFGEGPLKGLKNGDRLYKIELKSNTNLGTYHVIDGQRVTARYPGQQQTCARCFGTPQSCPGKGMARRCELEHGPKVEFNDYIYQLWNKIGYIPSQVELDPEINNEHISQDDVQFTPHKAPVQDSAEYAGVSVRTFPKETDHGEIVEFLLYSGLSESHKDSISIKPNGAVFIDNLPSKECVALIEAIHSKFNFGRRLYCNGIVPRTPEKDDKAADTPVNSQAQSSESTMTGTSTSSTCDPPPSSDHQHVASPGAASHSPAGSFSSSANTAASTTISSSSPMPDPVSPMSPNTFSQQYSETPDVHHLQLQPSNEQLVRRNSVSLRSPPLGSGPYLGSLADEILSSEIPKPNNHYEQARTILSNLKEMSERFSDLGEFASCNSTTSGEDTDISETDNDGFRKQSKGKRKKSRKHRLSTTPGKEHFMKKANLSSSPQ